MDYKKTLNLPRTDFPMKADLAKREPVIMEKWEQLDLYAKLRKVSKSRPRYILHDGPPYANGHIHLGTALNQAVGQIGSDKAQPPGNQDSSAAVEVTHDRGLALARTAPRIAACPNGRETSDRGIPPRRRG